MSKLKIGFQGRLGAYSESACLHLFGEDIELFPREDFENVYQLLQEGTIDFGVLPFENSTTGSIHDNYNLIAKYHFPIVAEVKLQIEHALLAKPGQTIEDLTEVRSHPQALAQCKSLFESYPNLIATPDFDTAGSAEKVAQVEKPWGAIASELAAWEYGLEVVKTNVETVKDNNFTRFLCLAPHGSKPMGTPNKTSLIYIPKENRSGVLFEALKIFADRGIDLLKVESSPRQGTPWQYIFYLDLAGDTSELPVAEALSELEAVSEKVIQLGHYEQGPTKKLFRKKDKQ